MHRYRVAVLSDHSLFAKGATARLRQSSDDFAISEMDPKDPHIFEQIAALAPESVIVDAADDELEAHISLSQLLNATPHLTIIRLDPSSDQIQVLTSKRRRAGTMDDLVEAISRLDEGI